MANIQPLVNGTAYSYVQCTAEAWGINILFTELNYKESQAKTNNYNNGKYASTRTYGKVEPTSNSITLDKKQNDALRAIAPSRRALHSLPPTDFRVTYANAGEPPTTDIIKNFEFKDNGNEGSVDDDYMTTSLETIFSHIE